MLDRKGHGIDVASWARSLSVEQIAERPSRVRCWIEGHLREVDGRLIAIRLPEDKAEEARTRARRELGSDANEETIEMAAYVILFTTAPQSRLSAARCIEAYRWRWQIELLFKRWKSICGFDRLPNERADTILSWLSARMLLGMIVDRMAASAISPPQRPAKRKRRVDHGARSVEDHEHSLARAHRGAHAAASA